MPAATIVDGLTGLDQVFEVIDRDVSEIDWQAFWDGQKGELEDDHHDYFGRKVSPHGEPWAKLAASTIKRKGHGSILIDTTALAKSLTQRGGSGAIRDQFSSGNMVGLVFGTSVPYAHWHMTGTYTMPARPEVGVTDDRIDKMGIEIADLIASTIIEADWQAVVAAGDRLMD